MPNKTKYFITDTGGIFINWYSAVLGLETKGQELELRGSTGDDAVYVGEGTQVDATVLGTGVDKIYLTGNFADYTQTQGGNSYTFSREIDGFTENVTFVSAFGENDFLFFADGSVNIGFDNLFDSGAYRAITATDLDASQRTPAYPIADVPQQGSGATKVFITDTDGENIAAGYQGAVLDIRGSSGVDTVYVGEGTQVDATVLGTGVDKIYLTGNFADYTQTQDSNSYTFSREIDGFTESVTFVSAFGENDLLFFADGSVNVGFNNLLDNGSFKRITQDMLSGDGTPSASAALTLAADSGSSSTDGITNDTTVNVSGLEPGTSWQYTLDGGDIWQAGSGTSFELAADTVYVTDQVQVKQTDAEGNEVAAGKLSAVTTDTSAPSAPTAIIVDTGSSSIDGITNATTVNVGNLEAGATWEYSTDNGDTWIVGTNTSFDLAVDTSYVTFQVQVRQTDVAGNVGNVASLPAVTTDNSGPIAASVTTLSSSSLTPTLVGTATLAAGESLTVVVNGATYENVTVTDGNWSIDTATQAVSSGSLGAFTDGETYSVEATATDSAGNSTVDSTINELTINTPLPATPTVDVVAINSATPVITGTATLATGDSLSVVINGATYDNVSVANNIWTINTATATPTSGTLGAFTDGSYDVVATVTNSAGATATDTTNSELTVDTTAPSALVLSLSSDTGASSTDGVTSDATINVTGITSNTTWQYSLDVGVSWTDGVGSSFELSGNKTYLQDDIQARQVDAVGNETITKMGPVTVDTVASTILIDDISTDNIIDTTESQSDVSVSGKTSDIEDGQVLTVRLNNTDYTATVNSNSWSVNIPAADIQALSGGENTLTANVTDLVGNVSVEVTKTFSLDTMPSISINDIASDNVIDSVEDNTDIVVSGTTSNVEDGQTVTVLLNGQTYTATVSSSAWTLNVPAADVQALATGTNAITADVSDAAGVSATQATKDFSYSVSIPAIGIDDVSVDNILSAKEDNSDVVISGTTSVEDGQTLTLTLNGKDYEAAVSGNVWSVTVPAADVQALAVGVNTITTNVSNALGVAAPEASKAITYYTTPLTITLDDTVLTAGDTATVTFSFKEVVTGFDKTDVTVEGGTLSEVTTADGGFTYTATFTPTTDTTDATNLIKVGTDFNYNGAAFSGEAVSEAASFTSGSVGVDVTGNSITKTVTDGWGSAGTFSDQSISNDGLVSTTVNETNTSRMIGLSDADDNQSDTSIDFALYLRSDGGLQVYENGSDRGTFGTYTTGDVLSVQRTGSTITYLINGGVFYTSTVGSAGDLFVDTALEHQGATLQNIQVVAGNIAAISDNYVVNTAMPTITINDVTDDNIIDYNENNSGVVISGTTTGVEDGQMVVVTLNGKDYQASVSGDAWSVTMPAADAQALASGAHTLTANVTNLLGVAAAETSKTITYDTALPLVITLDNTALAVGETATVTFSFKEVVTGFDKTDVTVQGGTLSEVTTADGGFTYTATFTPTTDTTDATNLIKVGTDFNYNGAAFAEEPASEAASFTSGSVGVDVTGNSFIKTAATGWNNAGTFSDQSISGNGSVSTTVDETNTTRLIGLSDADTDLGISSMDYALNIRSNGDLKVTENGTDRGTFGTYTTGDVLSVERTGSTITYLKNGDVFYTSTVASAGDLFVDTTLYHQNATLQNIQVAGNIAAISDNYEVNTVTPTISINDVTGDNIIDYNEDNSDVVISGTTTGVDGQTVIVMLNGKYYQSTVSGDAWSVTMPAADAEALASGSHTLTANVTNAQGVAAAEASKSITYDTTPPLTITLDDTALAVGETATVTFSFKEVVTGFDKTDVTVEGGTLSEVTTADGGFTYTATFTPTTDTFDATNLIKVGTDFTYNGAAFAEEPASEAASFTSGSVGVDVTGNSITKTAAIGWGSAGTFSDQSISGDGLVSTTANETDTSRMIGLSNVDTDQGYTSIDYAIYLKGEGSIEVIENGNYRGTYGTYTTGDVLSVQRTGSTITYLKNGEVLYTSTVASTGDLFVDTALEHQGATLQNIQVAGNIAAISDNYVVNTAMPTITINDVTDDNIIDYNEKNSGVVISGTTTDVEDGQMVVVRLNGQDYQTSVSGNAWSIIVPVAVMQTLTLGSHTLTANVTNLLGIVAAEASKTITYDTVLPLIITLDDTALAMGETATVTFSFKEVVTDFDNSDITVANGTLSAVTTADGGFTYTATFTPTTDISDTTNLIKVGTDFTYNGAAFAEEPVSEKARFTSGSVGVDVVGNSITKTADSGWGNAGTFSEQSISGDGSVFTTVNGVNSSRMIGFSDVDDNNGYTSIDYALYLEYGGSLQVYENGNYIGRFETYATGDVLSVQRTGTTITYLKNGTVFYTSTTASTGDLTVDTALNHEGATLQNIHVVDRNVTAISDNYVVNTVTSTIIIDDVSGDNIIDYKEDDFDFVISGTTIGVEDGQTLTLTLNGKDYQVSVFGDVWSVTVPVADAQALASGDHTLTATVTNVEGTVAAEASKTITHDTTPPLTITLDDTTLTAGETATVTFSFKEVVTGFDKTDVIVESGTLSDVTTADGGFTYTATFTPTTDITDTTNLIKVGTNFNYNGAVLEEGPASEAASFANGSVGVDVTGNSFIKTATTGWNAGTISDQSISGNGSVSTTVDETNTSRRIGFSEDIGQSFTNIDYAIYLRSNGVLYVYENGSVSGTFGTYTTGDVLSVKRTGSTITYLKNGEVFYTSTVASEGDLFVDTVLYHQGATLQNIQVERNAEISDNYVVNTAMPSISIDDVTGDNIIDYNEDNSDVVISGTTTGVEDGQTVVVTLNGKDYKATVSSDVWSVTVPAADAKTLTSTNTLTANVTNVGGVTATNSTEVSHTYVESLKISIDDVRLKAGDTATVTFSFNEVVTGFDNSDITVVNGTLSAVTSTDGGFTYTATFTPTTDTTDATNLIKVSTDFNYNGVAFAEEPASEAASFTSGSVGVVVTGNSITKTVTDGWGSAGTFSDQSISNDGLVSTTVNETNTSRMIGLSDADDNQSDTSIDFALYLRSDGGLQVYENGSDRGTFGTYTTGDVLSVQRTGSTITYLINGGGFYTSTVGSAGDLYVDTALDNQGATLQNIQVARNAAISDNYVVNTVTPTISIDDVTGDNIIDYNDDDFGVVISGTTTGVEDGQNVVVTLNGKDYQVSVSGNAWSVTVPVADAQALASGSHTLTANVTNVVGTVAVEVSKTITHDTTPPLTITLDDTALAAGDTATVTFSFKEVVTGFDKTDVIVESGTLSEVTTADGGFTYTATFTPTTDTTDATNLIKVSTGFNYNGAAFAEEFVSEAASFTNGSVGVDVTGNSFIKTADNGWSAGTFSDQSISGNGSVSTTVNETNTSRRIGLSYEDTDQGFKSIDYALYLRTYGRLHITENGIDKGTFGMYITGDILSVQRFGSTITYLKNGEVFYTSIVASAGDLFVDTTLYHQNATLQNIQVERFAAISDNYEVNTATAVVTIDDVTDDNVVDYSEDDVDLMISGSTTGVESGQTITVTLNGNNYQTTVSSTGAWIVAVAAADVQALAQGNHDVTVNVSNKVGDQVTANKSFNYVSAEPLSIDVADTGLTAGETTLVTFTFFAQVENFAVDDVTVENGTISNLSTSDGGLTYTATLTPDSAVFDSTNKVSVGNQWNFIAGNTESGNRAVVFASETDVDTIGNNITKTALNDDDWNSGTFSEQSISGDGWVSTTVNETNRSRMIGLSYVDTDQHSDSIDYAIYLRSDGGLLVYEYGDLQNIYENGEIKNTVDTYKTGDVVSIQRFGSTITYLNNGEVFYTSSVASVGDLYVDTSFRDTGSTLQNILINNGEFVSSNNYAVNTLTPTINIDAIAAENILNGVADNVSLIVSGTTTNISDGQIVTVNIAGVTYTTKVLNNTWGVRVPQAVAEALPSNTTVDVSVTNASGVNVTVNTVFSHTIEDPVAITISDIGIDSLETAVVTFRFKEAVNDFGLDDVSAASGSLSNLATIDGGKTYTATFTPTLGVNSDGNTITVGNNWSYAASGSSPVVAETKVAFDKAQTTDNVSINGNNLTKTAVGTSWNAGSFSENVLQGDGYVATTAAETDTERLIGLSDVDTDQSYTSIDYAIHLKSGGVLEIIENGVFRGGFGTYTTGDVLSVQRSGSTITYLKNGEVFYTSTVASAGDLFVDTSFRDDGATLNNIVIKDNTVAASSAYSVDTQIGFDTASVSGNVIVLTFDESLNALKDPSAQSFNIQVDGATRNVTAVSIAGNNVTLTIDGKAVVDSDKVELSYSQVGADGIENTAGVQMNNIEAVFGTAGYHDITGTSGSEHVIGTSGADTINAGAGADIINAGAGADIITGGSGNDTMTGGTGSDTFDYNGNDGNDTITDFTIGTGGDTLDLRDLLDYRSGESLSDYLDVTNDGKDVTIKVDKDGGGDEFTGPDVTITLQNINDANVTLSSLEVHNLSVL